MLQKTKDFVYNIGYKELCQLEELSELNMEKSLRTSHVYTINFKEASISSSYTDKTHFDGLTEKLFLEILNS
jgi:hypothetical protein